MILIKTHKKEINKLIKKIFIADKIYIKHDDICEKNCKCMYFNNNRYDQIEILRYPIDLSYNFMQC